MHFIHACIIVQYCQVIVGCLNDINRIGSWHIKHTYPPSIIKKSMFRYQCLSYISLLLKLTLKRVSFFLSFFTMSNQKKVYQNNVCTLLSHIHTHYISQMLKKQGNLMCVCACTHRRIQWGHKFNFL